MIEFINAHFLLVSSATVALVWCLGVMTRSEGTTLWGLLPAWLDVSTWSRYGLLGTVGQLLVTALLAGGGVLVAAFSDGKLTPAELEAAGQAVLAALGILQGLKQLSPARATRKQAERTAVGAVISSNGHTGVVSLSMDPHAAKRIGQAGDTVKLSTVLLVLLLAGCAGHLEEAKLAGLDPQARQAAPEPSERCQELDTRHWWAGGVAEAAAFGAGASGVATWPADSKRTEEILAITAGGLGLVAAGAQWMSSDAANAWAEEGCGR